MKTKPNLSHIIAAIWMAALLVSCTSHSDTTSATVSSDSSAAATTQGPPPPPAPGRLTSGKYLTQDSLYRFAALAPANIKSRGNGKPFSAIDYNKVIAYEFEGSEEPYPSILYGDSFAPVVTKQTALDPKQVNDMTALLTKTSTYGGAFASCFNPHLALVFYKDTAKVIVIDICLGCNYLISRPDIPATKLQKINAGTPGEYAVDGFSDEGKAKLRTFCDELGYVYAR